MSKENKFCKLCGEYCINKHKSSSYCKDCADIAVWFYGRKNTIKNSVKKYFPNKIITFKLIINKIEDKHGS